MPPTLQSSGTKTVAAIGTPETLLDIAVAGTFQGTINLVNLAAGDVYEIYIYKMVLTATTREILWFDRWSGAQPDRDRLKQSLPVSNILTDAGSIRFEVNQTKGVARAVPWEVLKF